MARLLLLSGLATGGAIVLFSLVLFWALGDFADVTVDDLKRVEAWGYARYLFLLLGVVGAMVVYRRRTEGSIGYGRMLGLGVGVAVVTGLIVGLLEGIYVAVNPDFFDHYNRLAGEAMRADGATPERLAALRKQQEDFAWMRDPAALGVFYFFETTFFGSLIAIAAAAFTRRAHATSVADAGEPSPLSAASPTDYRDPA